MVLSDFLSRQKSDDSNPHEIIPILFNLRETLYEGYHKLGNFQISAGSRMDKYMVQTRAQVKSSGIKLPEVHRAKKE